MPKVAKGGWYGVAIGRQTGVYTTWDECSEQVKGFSKSKYKKFSTKSQAEEYVRTNRSNHGSRNQGSSTQGSSTPGEVNKGTGTVKPIRGANVSTTPNRSQHNSTLVKSVFYGVARGHSPGVYRTWADCHNQVRGFQQPLYRKCTSEAAAMTFCTDHSEPPNQKFSGETERSFDSSLSDLGTDGGDFSPTKPAEVDESFSDFEEIEEESNNEVLREIAALITQSRDSGTQSHDLNTSSRPVVYTDGSCLNQGKGAGQRRAGIGVYWGPGDPRNCSEKLWGLPTNQRAELWAAVRALQTGLSAGYRKLEVRTDSQYTIKGITEWIKRWKKNDYHDAKGQPVKNKELFSCLDSLTNMVDVRWAHVKAHCGEPGNEAADRLARDGAKL